MQAVMNSIHTHSRWLALALSIGSAVFASACCELPPKPDTPPADLAELVTQQVGYLVDANRIAGAAVGVVVDGAAHTYFFGETKLGSGTKPDGDTVYEIGSITKTMTAALLALAVAENEGLTLESPAAPLLPDGYTLPAFEGREITLGDLASHTSSLPRLPENLGTWPRDPYARYTMADLKSFLEGYALNATPGTRYEYSNLGASILGIAMANRADSTYDALLASRILGPLGMSDSAIALSETQQQRLAAPYASRGLPLDCLPPRDSTNWNLGIFAPAGGIKSTLNDMLKYLKASMAPEGTVLEPIAPLLFQGRFAVNEGMTVALGWHFLNGSGGAPDIIWHNGGTGGYSTFMGFFRGTRTGIVLLANTSVSGEVDAAALSILNGIAELPSR
jgi:CubicO group peptidase (beta-lactamase class C family)